MSAIRRRITDRNKNRRKYVLMAAKKTISKKTAYQIISEVLRNDAPYFRGEGDINISSNLGIYKKIASLLSGTKYGYNSVIYHIINKNNSFKTFFFK